MRWNKHSKEINSSSKYTMQDPIIRKPVLQDFMLNRLAMMNIEYQKTKYDEL